jgi:hypothetical protein
MKLRIRSNTVRVRLSRKDLTELLERGRVVDVLRFGPGSTHTFTFAVVVGTAPAGYPQANYASGLLVIIIDRGDATALSEGNRVSFDHEQVVEGGTVRVILEKDFTSLERPVLDEMDETWAAPNPSAV